MRSIIVLLFMSILLGSKLYSFDNSIGPHSYEADSLLVYEAGFAIGNPSALNLNLIYHHDQFIFRATGGYLGPLHGLQLDFGYKIYQTYSMYHAFSIAGGFSRYPKNNNIFDTGDEGANYDYVSLNYIFNYNGLQLGAGLSTGEGNLSSPRVSVQIGFNLQFR